MEKEMFFTNDETVERICGKEAIFQLINRHCCYNGNDMRREELDLLWVKNPENQETASLGYNNGWYLGMNEIARHYVDERETARYANLKAHCEADPTIEYCAANLGYGIGSIQTATTPLVYIADDGQTARYQGFRLSYQAAGKPDGSADAYMDFGIINADLVNEDGQWKIWHLFLGHDHTVVVGERYADGPIIHAFGEDPLELEFGTPTIQRTAHNPLFGWEMMYEDMPRPYSSYEPIRSYGPEGVLGLPYYIRDRR